MIGNRRISVYRVGWPLWKLAAKAGVGLLVRVHVHFDDESQTYWADSPDLDGLVVSGADLDELHAETIAAANTLLTLAVRSPNARATTEMRIRDDSPMLAA